MGELRRARLSSLVVVVVVANRATPSGARARERWWTTSIDDRVGGFGGR